MYVRSHFGSSQLGARRTGNSLDLVVDGRPCEWLDSHRPWGGAFPSYTWTYIAGPRGLYAAQTFMELSLFAVLTG